MTVILSLLLAALAGGSPADATAPCIRPTRAGTQVQGEVRVCPGRYRIADPSERGVIVAASSGTRIDLTGVVLESGDSVPARFTGIGVVSKDVDRVSILGGTIRGYRIGLRLEGGASAVAAASIFHFTEQTPAGAKLALLAAGRPRAATRWPGSGKASSAAPERFFSRASTGTARRTGMTPG